MPNESVLGKLHLSRLLPNLAGLFLAAFGSITLAWVGQLTWYDMTTWSKDVALVFFGSRTGEAISLGIDMKVIHYFLIGLALFISGLLILLRRRIRAIKLHHVSLLRAQPKKKRKEEPVKPPAKEEEPLSGCLHHFGYLSSRPENAPIQQECLICPRLGKCMVMTVFTDKATFII